MSDDLVKDARSAADQLEEWVQSYTGIKVKSIEAEFIRLLADRIEELEAAVKLNQDLDAISLDHVSDLEAKLAKAFVHVADYSNDPHLVRWAYHALSEINGGGDE